jgi:hypothetical protein
MDFLNTYAPGPSFLNLITFFILGGFAFAAKWMGYRGQGSLPFAGPLYLVVAIIAVDFLWSLWFLPARAWSLGLGRYGMEDFGQRTPLDWLAALAKVGLYLALVISFVQELRSLRPLGDPAEPEVEEPGSAGELEDEQPAYLGAAPTAAEERFVKAEPKGEEP